MSDRGHSVRGTADCRATWVRTGVGNRLARLQCGGGQRRDRAARFIVGDRDVGQRKGSDVLDGAREIDRTARKGVAAVLRYLETAQFEVADREILQCAGE